MAINALWMLGRDQLLGKECFSKGSVLYSGSCRRCMYIIFRSVPFGSILQKINMLFLERCTPVTLPSRTELLCSFRHQVYGRDISITMWKDGRRGISRYHHIMMGTELFIVYRMKSRGFNTGISKFQRTKCTTLALFTLSCR